MELMGLLALAFGFGLLHALDADHVLAVTGLSSMKDNSSVKSTTFSLRWALGHGLSILLIGSLVVFFGMAIPYQFSSLAEELVGFMLLGIGILVITDLVRQRNTLYMHKHDQWPVHVHLQTSKTFNPLHKHRHGAVMVGLLHGAAGSAPLLALLPVTQLDSSVVAMSYLLLFCLGVLLSMLVVGGVLGSVCQRLGHISMWLPTLLRSLVAILSIGMGLYLITLGAS